MEEQNQTIGAGRRSVLPPMEKKRMAFDRTLHFLHIYSSDIFAKSESGEYQVPSERIKEIIQADIAELKKQDPLINLLLLLKSESFRQEEELKVGSYMLVHPTIKQLNGIYLGPEQTDQFISELNQEIAKILTANNAVILNINYRGGCFLLKNGFTNPGLEQQIFEMKIQQIQRNADQILLSHIERRLSKLKQKYATEQIDKIKENIDFLEELRAQIFAEKTGVKIAIGFDNCPRDSKEAFWGIRNAECAANKCANNLKRANGNSENIAINHYDDVEIIFQIIKASQEIANQILDENGEIKADWQKYFSVDPQTGYIRMQSEMINIYRNFNAYLISRKFLDLSSEEKRDFEQKIKIFEKYYLTINIVDVLKNFRAARFEHYSEQINNDVNLIQEAEKAITENGFDQERLRQICATLSSRLELSVKDEGDGIIGTNRAIIGAIIREQGPKLLLSSDIIGFGGLNQQSYERSAQQLIDLLGISSDEWQECNGDDQKLKKLISKKLETARKSPQFKNTLLSIGDHGTKKIRKSQKVLHAALGGKAYINAEGGDETVALYVLDNSQPIDLNEIERNLLAISRETRIRIAGVFGDISFSKIPQPSPLSSVPHNTREEIKAYNTASEAIEFAQSEIKALNALGLHKVSILKYPNPS